MRRVANSRVRWATVIESVLKITKAPTKSAMPANASRKYRMKLVNSTDSWSLAPAARRFARSHGRAECIANLALELRRRDPVLRGDGDGVELTFALEQPLRGRNREDGECRVPSDSTSPYCASPTTLNVLDRLQGRDLDGVADLVALLRRPCAASSTTSPDVCGQRALDELQRIERAARPGRCRSRKRARRRCSRPCLPWSRILVVRLVDDAARGGLDVREGARPRRASAPGSAAARSCRPGTRCPRALPETTASVLAYDSWKMPSNALSIVSVRT